MPSSFNEGLEKRLNLNSDTSLVNPNSKLEKFYVQTDINLIRNIINLCFEFLETTSWYRTKSWDAFKNTYLTWRISEKVKKKLNPTEEKNFLEQDTIKRYQSIARRIVKKLQKNQDFRFFQNDFFKYGTFYDLAKEITPNKIIYELDLKISDFKIKPKRNFLVFKI